MCHFTSGSHVCGALCLPLPRPISLPSLFANKCSVCNSPLIDSCPPQADLWPCFAFQATAKWNPPPPQRDYSWKLTRRVWHRALFLVPLISGRKHSSQRRTPRSAVRISVRRRRSVRGAQRRCERRWSFNHQLEFISYCQISNFF